MVPASHLILRGSGNIAYELKEGFSEQKTMEDLGKILSFVYDKAKALMVSCHLCLLAQELHNQASQHSSKEEAWTHTLPLLSVKLLTAGGYQERQYKVI